MKINHSWFALFVLPCLLLVSGCQPSVGKEKVKPVIPSVGNYEKIGWRPIIGDVHHEPTSGFMSYVTVAINSNTNDVNSYRTCFVGCFSTGALYCRDNHKTGQREVYVVSKNLKSFKGPAYFALDL